MKATRKLFFIKGRFESNLLIFEQMGLGERKAMIWNQSAEYGGRIRIKMQKNYLNVFTYKYKK
jgi:hypothetical protein